MRYFTRELWIAGNSSDTDAAKAAGRLWRERIDEYQAERTHVLVGMSDRTRAFFEDESLHDGRVVEFSLREVDHEPTETVATFVVDVPYSRERFVLRYRGVAEIEVSHVDSRVMFGTDGSIFGDWGYDEVSTDEKGRVVHSILFSSGMEARLACADLEWNKDAQPGATDNPDDAQRI